MYHSRIQCRGFLLGNLTLCSPFSTGMDHEGLFRVSGNHRTLENLKAKFDRGLTFAICVQCMKLKSCSHTPLGAMQHLAHTAGSHVNWNMKNKKNCKPSTLCPWPPHTPAPRLPAPVRNRFSAFRPSASEKQHLGVILASGANLKNHLGSKTGNIFWTQWT